ncbi:MAG TPA: hypothetical protein VIV58_12635, partial [Kofleriaceae bacterium]
MRALLVVMLLALPIGRAYAGDCFAELDARHVAYKHASRPGIQLGVELTGTVGGIALTSEDQPLVIDCSLAVSLDEAGK